MSNFYPFAQGNLIDYYFKKFVSEGIQVTINEGIHSTNAITKDELKEKIGLPQGNLIDYYF